MKRLFITLVVLLSAASLSYSQTDSLYAQSSIRFGFGLGGHGGDSAFDSGGTFLTLGYDFKKNERLRYSFSGSLMSSNFNLGSSHGTSAFKSYTLRAIANYDFVRKRRFSIYGGIGPVANLTTGSVRPDFSPEFSDTLFTVGAGVNLGLRFEPKGKGLGFEFVPLNAHFNTANLGEVFLQFKFFKVL